jgi:hypothetical protein
VTEQVEAELNKEPGGVCTRKAQEFVDAIRKVVIEVIARSLVSVLRDPPGRRPDVKLVGAKRPVQSAHGS